MPISQTVLASPVIAAAIALLAFIPSAAYFYILRKNKADVAINLIHQYAEYAKTDIQNSLGEYSAIKKKILDDKYSENYTPLLCYTGMGKLSFEQVSEIRQYLTKDEQDSLFAYLMAESNRDALVWAINTDFLRKFRQDRKVATWDVFMEEEANVEKKAEALMTVLNRRKKTLLRRLLDKIKQPAPE